MSATTCHAACEALDGAVRDLIHDTRPALSSLTGPAEAGEVIASLAAATGMLPQLSHQLAGSLIARHDAGRLRLDSGAPPPDVRQAVHAAVAALEHAGRCLDRASLQLDRAHQHVAQLATDDNGCLR